MTPVTYSCQGKLETQMYWHMFRGLSQFKQNKSIFHSWNHSKGYILYWYIEKTRDSRISPFRIYYVQ